jgi:hypothetical protein
MPVWSELAAEFCPELVCVVGTWSTGTELSCGVLTVELGLATSPEPPVVPAVCATDIPVDNSAIPAKVNNFFIDSALRGGRSVVAKLFPFRC